MSASPRPQLKDARRKFWWGEHDLIDYGVIAHVGTSAWAVYTCLLRHINDEGSTFPSVPLLMVETGLSNRVIAQSVARLKDVSLIDVDRASHQWNVYIILDVVHAIKKNRWERVEKKARDEKSPARQGRPTGKKQVTKSHLAGDEKSPEQVTKSHPNKNHLKRTREEGGVLDVTGNAPARDPDPSPPVAEPDQPPHTTTTDAALQKDEGRPVTATPEALITPAAEVPNVAAHEQQPPDGGAADAADEDLLSLEQLAWLSGRDDGQATDLEKVPGGAAAGAVPAAEAPRTSGEVPRTPSVTDLAPVDRSELLTRPVAALESEQFRLIRALVTGKQISDGLLDQPTPTGGFSREDWLRLTLAELEGVRDAARAEAQAAGGNMITLAIRGLDRMIGAAPKAKGKKASTTGIGGQDPADMARHDPQLSIGQRCQVDGQLGVIFDVTVAAYLVDLDDGERLTIDRALARQLHRLQASDALTLGPRVAAERITLADVGTRWQPKSGGEVLTVQGVEGANRLLSNNARIAVYLLTSKFVQASA